MFELPPRIPNYLKALAIFFKNGQENLLCEIIDNSSIEIKENTNRQEDLSGNSYYGHSIVLQVPIRIYQKIPSQKEKNRFCKLIYEGLNEESSIIPDEFIQGVSIQLMDEDTDNAVAASAVTFPEPVVDHLWRPSYIRAFISHKDSHKREVEQLKEELFKHGISSFVAHTSIEPTRQWVMEIIKALSTMDVMIAYLSEDFNTGFWTNQELGYAYANRIKIIPVKVSITDPSGLIADIQAIPGNYNNLKKMAADISKYVYSDEYPAYHCVQIDNGKKINAVIDLLAQSHNFARTGEIYNQFHAVMQQADSEQLKALVKVYEQNSQVSGWSSIPPWRGEGKTIMGLIEQITGKRYKLIYNDDIKKMQLVEVEPTSLGR